jgi:hypothetical protein
MSYVLAITTGSFRFYRKANGTNVYEPKDAETFPTLEAAQAAALTAGATKARGFSDSYWAVKVPQ